MWHHRQSCSHRKPIKIASRVPAIAENLAKGIKSFKKGMADDPVQYIDIRDSAEWMIRLAEEKQAGTFNAVGPKAIQGVLEFANLAKEAFPVDTNLILIDDREFLHENRVSFIIPWISPDDDYYASARVNNTKAAQAGLTFRDLKDTIKDTHDWWFSEAVTEERRAKYNESTRSVMARETAILEAWSGQMKK